MTQTRPGVDELLALRLRHQLIELPATCGTAPAPAEVVSRLCAMQAQDYAGALWSVGLRSSPECTIADVERDIAERRIVRTWPMRGTLHFTSPADVRWMLSLLSPRILHRARTRHQQLGIAPAIIDRARDIFSDALSGGKALTRNQMMERLEADGIDTTGQRGYHVLWTLAQEGVLCFGPREGGQQTFVLLDEWIGPLQGPPLERTEAVALLATRYLGARGPATAADLAWWAGITKSEARAAIESAATHFERLSADGEEYWLPAGSGGQVAEAGGPRVHLLPGFDEYLLGYTDRSLQLGGNRGAYAATVSANGMFSATVVIDGRVAGAWKRTLKRERVDIAVRPLRALTPAEKTGLAEAAERYGRFVRLEACVAL